MKKKKSNRKRRRARGGVGGLHRALGEDVLGLVVGFLCPRGTDLAETVEDVLLDLSDVLDMALVCRDFRKAVSAVGIELFAPYKTSLWPTVPFEPDFVRSTMAGIVRDSDGCQDRVWLRNVHSGLRAVTSSVQGFIRRLPDTEEHLSVEPDSALAVLYSRCPYRWDHSTKDPTGVGWVAFVQNHYDFPKSPVTHQNMYDFEDHGVEPWAFFLLWKGDIASLDMSIEETLECLKNK